MSHSNPPRPQTRRPPLGDATLRVNNAHDSYPSSPEKQNYSIPHHESLKPGGQLSNAEPMPTSPGSRIQGNASQDRQSLVASPGSNIPNPRLSAISKEGQTSNSNRNSQISTTSTNASDSRRRKTHIGPWQLGKTLGKGATARVRMARHAITGQPAAIKIVQKKNAQLSQAGSLASLDRKDAAFTDRSDGIRRMPYGIEREVAIMKLIEHPHIMKLYDIWENRTEIYLVLEYVDNGELFEHISREGRLREEEALKYFRQLLSAVGYCHQFHICHRDLKPENILLTKGGDVKIADFGMAALQQTPEHRLQTSCGSPHYAAPEVIKAVPYRGDKVDIWSMGVILYASLSGRLPFDNPTLPGLLAMIQKGQYRMASCIGPEAADLIHRMLQIDPRDRLSINQIWRHPLLRKYDYLDDFGGGSNPRLPDIRECGRPVLRKSDIDKELLRHLRSMWHQFEESQLIKLLLNDQSNDQKLFYSLLLKHREIQLENYIPDISYSNSDYHHAKPLAQVKKLSSRQFTQPSSKGHGRQVSRFTIISNISKERHSRKNSDVAEQEATETVHSYDPFKGSRPRNLVEANPAQANVVVHRNPQEYENASKAPDTRVYHQAQSKQNILVPPKGFSSRSSLASSTRSRGSASVVRPSLAHKRGISFSHVRKSSVPKPRMVSDSQVIVRHNRNSEDLVDTIDKHETPQARTTSPSQQQVRSKKEAAQHTRTSRLWHEDVRKLSNSLAKDCDEAFNRTSIASSNPTHHTQESYHEEAQTPADETPLSSFDRSSIPLEFSNVPPSHLQVPTLAGRSDRSYWESRPLPPPPARSESVNIELAEARRQAEIRKSAGSTDTSPGHLEKMVSHIDRLMEPISSTSYQGGDRRAASAPVQPRGTEEGKYLPSIHEFDGEDVPEYPSEFERSVRHTYPVNPSVGRAASDPRYHRSKNAYRPDQHEEFDTVLESPSPAKAPAPLNIRKKKSQGPASKLPVMTGALGVSDANDSTSYHASALDLREQYLIAPENALKYAVPDEQGPTSIQSHHPVQKKRSNWFRRSSKSAEDEKGVSIPEKKGISATQHASDHIDNPLDSGTVAGNKKKTFALGRLFRKRNSKQENDMAVTGFEIYDEEGSAAASVTEYQRHPYEGPGADLYLPKQRQIEPQQNWLARLFHVKPAMKLMCFSVSKRRARQEIVVLLKEWRKYGTKDIFVDKERNIVFGKVGAKNYLQMKEVAFASEIMTVIEHGKRSPLSIARFTQETGAASSFYKVVDTLETVVKSRGMLVSDDRKKNMMIKTLNTL